MTEQFKTTAAYRHWMARHDLEALDPATKREMLSTIAMALPPNEVDHWMRVQCAYGDRFAMPGWFIKEVGELNDY